MSDDEEKNKNYIDRICIGGGALTGAFFALSMAFFFRFNTSVDWYLFGAVSFFVVAGLCVAAALLAAKYNRRWIVEPTFSTEAEPRDLSVVFTSCGGFAAGLFLMLALIYGFRINMQVAYSIGLGALFAVLTLFTVLLAFLGSRYYRLKAKQESEGIGMTVLFNDSKGMGKRDADDSGAKRAKKIKRRTTLFQLMATTDSDIGKSPLMKLNVDQFVRLLNVQRSVDYYSDDEEEEESSEQAGEEEEKESEQFALGFSDIAQLMLSCREMALFFCQEILGDGWRRLADDRLSVLGREPFFSYIPAYLHKVGIKRKETIWTPLYFYLNIEGFPACPECGIRADIRGSGKEDDEIGTKVPISPFFLKPGAGGRRRKSNESDEKKKKKKKRMARMSPAEKNLTILRDSQKHNYLCVNPRCRAALELDILNFPVACLFDACAEKNTRDKHSFRSMELGINAPSGKELDLELKYCCNCGVLKVDQKELKLEGVKRNECRGEMCMPIKKAILKKAKKEGDQDKLDELTRRICYCDPCSLCKLMPIVCLCEHCDRCKRCEAKKCKVCKEKCECAPAYCDECLNDWDMCECSGAESVD